MWSRPVAVLALLLSAHAHPPPPPGDGPAGPHCVSLATEHSLRCPSTGVASRTTYFVCSSGEAGQRAECPVAVPPFRTVTAVTLEAALGKSRCVEGETYGVEGARVWVKDGCTATFAAAVGLDAARCADFRQRLVAEGCEGALRDIATCQADIAAFCSDVALPEAGPMGPVPPPFGWDPRGPHGHGHGHGPRPGEADDEDGTALGRPDRGHGGPHGPPHGPPHGRRGGCGGRMLERAFGPAPLSPAAAQLGQCLKAHLEQLGPQCRQTAAVEVLTRPPPPIEEAVLWAMLAAAAAGAVLASLGCAYFFWQRARLQARRGVAAEKTGRWSTSLFAPDVRSLLPSCLCPWFQSALNQAEVHDRDASLADVATNVASHSLVSNTYLTRQALRHKYDLPNTPIRDFLTAAFCMPCAIAQHTRELEARHGAQQLPTDDVVVVGQPVPKEPVMV
eukprot:EG_transcript_10549